MIKQTLTPKRQEQVIRSMQVIAILAELIKLEHAVEMDVRLKNPRANQYASKIKEYATYIHQELVTHDFIKCQIADRDFVETYSGELFRVVHFFIGMEIETIRETMDKFEALARGEVLEEIEQ